MNWSTSGDRRIQVSIFYECQERTREPNPHRRSGEILPLSSRKIPRCLASKIIHRNERTTLVIEDNDDQVEILMRQIAGTVARRIKFYVEEGEDVSQGAEFGFIKFGSQVDLFLPLHAIVEVTPGQKVKGKLSLHAFRKALNCSLIIWYEKVLSCDRNTGCRCYCCPGSIQYVSCSRQ